MSNPLVYSCSMQDLIGRPVVSHNGHVGTITEIHVTSDYPIRVKFKAPDGRYFNSSYSSSGWEYANSSRTGGECIKFLDEKEQPKTNTDIYKEKIRLIRKHTGCTADQAITLYEELNA